MFHIEEIKLIQGGMGVYVSNWRLAKAVAMQKPGVTVGTVSATALDVCYVRLLQLGDPGATSLAEEAQRQPTDEAGEVIPGHCGGSRVSPPPPLRDIIESTVSD